MGLIRLCPICHGKVDYGKKCKCEIDKQKQKYRQYKYDRKDKKEQVFYSSSEWIRIRNYVKSKQLNCCLFCWFKDNIFNDCDLVHHIIELKEDWNKRIDVNNLICLCSHHHKFIHDLYNKSEKDKEEMRRFLGVIGKEWKKQFSKDE